MTSGFMRLPTLQFVTKLQKYIRMGITIFKFPFVEVYRRIYVRKSRFTAPLARRSKTKFPTVYPATYLPKWKFLIQLSPNCVYLCDSSKYRYYSIKRLPKQAFKNIFDLTTSGDWDFVAAVERLPALHYSVDFIFLSFEIMGFMVEL